MFAKRRAKAQNWEVASVEPQVGNQPMPVPVTMAQKPKLVSKLGQRDGAGGMEASSQASQVQDRVMQQHRHQLEAAKPVPQQAFPPSQGEPFFKNTVNYHCQMEYFP